MTQKPLDRKQFHKQIKKAQFSPGNESLTLDDPQDLTSFTGVEGSQ